MLMQTTFIFIPSLLALGLMAPGSSAEEALLAKQKRAPAAQVPASEEQAGPVQQAGPVGQVQLIAPDNNEVTITFQQAKKQGLTAFPRLHIAFLNPCEGAKAPEGKRDLLKVAERQMELKTFIRSMAALPPEQRRLSELQEESLAEMPLCDEYLLDLLTLSRLLDGYQLRE